MYGNDQTNKFVLERLIKTFYLAIVRDTDIEAFVEVCFSAMRSYGYDPFKAMDETIKEISSRTGHFDDTINKFVKDKSPEAMSRWYKADYSKAR